MITTVDHDEAIASPTDIPEPVRCDEDVPHCGGQQTTSWLAKRLWVATFDLGLSEILPDRWTTPTADGLTFGTLSIRQADRFVQALEDLAFDHEPVMPAPGPGQLSLLESGS